MADLSTKLVQLDATSPGQNANFGSFTVPGWCTRLTISIAAGAAATLKIGFNGGTLVALGAALSTNVLQNYQVPVNPTDVIVFQIDLNTSLTRFLVDGYPGGAAI